MIRLRIEMQHLLLMMTHARNVSSISCIIKFLMIFSQLSVYAGKRSSIFQRITTLRPTHIQVAIFLFVVVVVVVWRIS
jgi:hypothetical protein